MDLPRYAPPRLGAPLGLWRTLPTMLAVAIALGLAVAADASELFQELPASQRSALSAVAQQHFAKISARPSTASVTVVRAQPTSLDQGTVGVTLAGAGSMQFTTRARSAWTPGEGWIGDLAAGAGTAVLTRRGQKILGSITDGSDRYWVEPLGDDGLHAVSKIDLSQIPPDEPPSFDALAARTPQTAARSGTRSTVATIDVLLVYTRFARMNNPPIDQFLEFLIFEANKTYADNGVSQTLRLAGSLEIDYYEGEKPLEQVLEEFSSRQDVQTRRANLSADVVILITGLRANYCGIAKGIAVTAPDAYGIAQDLCARLNYTLPHEIGHLQGARHDPDHDPTQHPFPYGHGFRHTPATGGQWRTIMGIFCPGNTCPRLGLWSTPHRTFDGIPQGEASCCDNARVLNETAGVMADFATSPRCAIVNAAAPDFTTWATTPGIDTVLGDFNGDRRTDLALLRHTPGWETIPVARSLGEGGWTVSNPFLTQFAFWATTPGAEHGVGDFNGDGRDDIVLLNRSAGWTTIPIAFADGQGGWTSTNGQAEPFTLFAQRPEAESLEADFDGDGLDDIALLESAPGWTTIPVAFADGQGNWQVTNQQASPFTELATADGAHPVLADFDGDGRDDVGLVKRTPGWTSIPVVLSQGRNGWQFFDRPAPRLTQAMTTPGAKILTGNFDGNGRDDLVVLQQQVPGAPMVVALASETGWWEVENIDVAMFGFQQRASEPGVWAAMGDFNGDHLTDIALINRSSPWQEIPTALSNGDGTFTVIYPGAGSFGFWAATGDVRPFDGDFDGDGRTDFGLLRLGPGWSTIPLALSR